MRDRLLKTLETDQINQILKDGFDWLLKRFGDKSLELNKLNYTRKQVIFSCHNHKLTVNWSFNPRKLDWYYYGQYAEYDAGPNKIYIACEKSWTVEFMLKCLFHEYRHSQQSLMLYSYYKVNYNDHPLEADANRFEDEWVPIYLREKLM
jgi:hypothetical protein